MRWSVRYRRWRPGVCGADAGRFPGRRRRGLRAGRAARAAAGRCRSRPGSRAAARGSASGRRFWPRPCGSTASTGRAGGAGRRGSRSGVPQRVRRWMMVPGSSMPVRAMAASSAAILAASAWWLAATRAVSGRSVISGISYCTGGFLLYKCSVKTGPGVARYVAGWGPPSVSPRAAAFARQVVPAAGPGGRERAKNLLWAAAKLADYGTGLGLDAEPQVLLHPSVIERFTAHAPGLSGSARRTLRTNLRFIARRGGTPRLGAGRHAAAAGASQGALQPGGDRRLPGAGRCAADTGPADAGRGAGLPGGRGRADPL